MTTTDSSSQLQLSAHSHTPDSAEHLASLYTWLLEDSGASEAVAIKAISRENDVEMAGVLEAVLAIAEQSVSLGSLVLAYLTWRSSVGRGADQDGSLRVHVKINGTSLSIDGMSDGQLRELIDSLNRGNDVASR